LVLHLARKDHIPTKEIRLKPLDLTSADECFITNTTIEVLPVTRVDGNVIGNGRPGPVTTALREAYQREVARDV
jgi:branched-subunit amino acid aminotransferase/4-amino-4-deoxychorismate lyase